MSDRLYSIYLLLPYTKNNHFYSGNILSDVIISESSTKEFFEDNREYFEPLVKAHLVKIDEMIPNEI